MMYGLWVLLQEIWDEKNYINKCLFCTVTDIWPLETENRG